jgi:hypothetical protein
MTNFVSNIADIDTPEVFFDFFEGPPLIAYEYWFSSPPVDPEK